jgi:hypothetical protein
MGAALLAIALISACGKKDKEDKGDQKADKPAPSAAGGADTSAGDAPDKAAVAGMDCDKACNVQFECARKNGMLSPQAKLTDCTQGCEMIKAVYDPARMGVQAKRMLSYAAGSCD